MLRIVILILMLGFSGQALAYDCEKLSEKDSPSTLLGCAHSAREVASVTLKALEATRSIAENSTNVLELLDLNPVRTSAYDLHKAAQTIHNNMEVLLGPETRFSYTMRFLGFGSSVDPFMLLRKLYATEATFMRWLGAAEPKIVKLIERFSIQGTLLSGGERLRSILEKPVDALLAQKGMLWVFKHRCTSVEHAAAACEKSTFPAEFRVHYGIDATEENVWWLGFLNRRDLEHRGMAAKFQKVATDFLRKIDKQE